LMDFVGVIDWSRHLTEERSAERKIISYQREILPFIAANIGSKISASTVSKMSATTRKKKNKAD